MRQRHAAPITTVWTGAAPAGFLAAPQLVKFVLPVLGLGGYFLAFSAFPLVVLLLLVLVVYVQLPVRAGDRVRPRNCRRRCCFPSSA